MLLYATTVFLSAFLLFHVQPMIAKIILPWFGGSAAVWTTCMLFFQSMLVAGYLYSHWTIRRLTAPKQAFLHIALLGFSLLALPVTPAEAWKPAGGENPTVRILLLLAVTVGIPYWLLSSTGPLIQAWYARAFPSASPYRLFSLSNLGSMLALLAYPVLVEPFLPTRQQAFAWSAAYVAFAGLCAVCAWRSRHPRQAASFSSLPSAQTDASLPSAQTDARPQPRHWLFWLGLTACASALLLSVTNHLTQDVAPIPFLWVLPLSLYLTSFILTFDSSGWYSRGLYLPLTAAALGGMSWALGTAENLNIPAKLAIFSASLFLCCMTCHGEVAALKPHPRYLTGFYLMISLGGALGALFVAVIAPYCFSFFLEMPVAMISLAVLVLAVNFYDPASPLHRTKSGWGWVAGAAVTLAISVNLVRYLQQSVQFYRVVARNFYGSLKTADYGTFEDHNRSRKLTHGIINHGEQYLVPGREKEPTSYFGPTTGVARAIHSKNRNKTQRIGITGLGAGVMLTYARPGDYYRIYEINPLVVDIAKREFTFIRDCPAQLDIVLGDARLSLEREPPQNFDVLHLDAFSSDSVPVHLLTREAFQIYFKHLQPDGYLVIHISNRYLDLQPVVACAVEALGKYAVLVEDPGSSDGEFFSTDMVVVSSRREALQTPLLRDFPPPKRRKGVNLWTDDYSNLFRIMKK
ncbi:MAG: fused MFS/spermidine synthase [Bryobacteraceae bacterium]|nr:fused MFS/spermidine synthase [Bryobacteraceae bacterium]MDW8378935.1 fused MFS/spermidine synthase [Bryobacterales bacterium]